MSIPPLEKRALHAYDPADARDEALADELAARRETAQDAPEGPRVNGTATHVGQGRRGPLDRLTDAVSSLLTPYTTEELAAARQPHPHAFQFGDTGAFPVGEVSVIGAPGREGKTTAIVAICAAYALGRAMGGLMPQDDRSVVVLSAEDDRRQFARKLGAHALRLTPGDAKRLLERVIVPDLDDDSVRPWRELVKVVDRQPVPGDMVAAAIEALRPALDWLAPLGLVVIETASTMSEAAEDNAGHRAMALACRRIARELGVAVVLIHHTSQAAGNNLQTLEISSADIRGGTALVNNTRQSWLLVSLGSDSDPHPEQDARTVLRALAAPGAADRVTALICLDSSKSDDPPPVFWRWDDTPSGPRMTSVMPPEHVAGRKWRAVHKLIRGARAEARLDAREDSRRVEVRRVVAIVGRLDAEGRQPTTRAVSTAAGRSPGWAAQYLAEGLMGGAIRSIEEQVPHQKGLSVVYRPSNSRNASVTDANRCEGIP